MSPPDKDRARRVGAELGKDCSSRIAQANDELDLTDPMVWAILNMGYLAGVHHGEQLGDRAGYAEGDRDGYDRGAQQRRFDLAAADPDYWVDRDLKPLDPLSTIVRRRREYRGITGEPVRPQTPEQIRAQAEYSWRRAERAVTEQGRRAG